MLKLGTCDGKQTSNSRRTEEKNTGTGWGSDVKPNYTTDKSSGWSTGATTRKMKIQRQQRAVIIHQQMVGVLQ